MTTSSKRPEHVAWASLILSVVFFGLGFFLGRWSGFFAVSIVGWLSLAAALIWLVLAVQFHQRALAEQERLDTGRLLAERQDSTIFEPGAERAAVFDAAQRRLATLEKWFIPIFSAVIAAYELVLGLLLLRAIPTNVSAGESPPFLLCAVCMTAVAFLSFLMSRYATGMSAQRQWKPLRAGGSFLLGLAVFCFVLAVGLALANFQVLAVVTVLNFAGPIVMIVLGVETALNVVLDIYRPRLKGRYSRAAFDSRLLGIINEPGGIFRSAASAIDYQFGFKVSQTWFYKLLEKAIVPLVLFGAATLYLLSCVVVVPASHEAIIEHLGNPRDAAGNVRLLGPGLAFKWPWPIDTVRSFPTQRISELYIGYVPKTDPKTGQIIREKQLLWGSGHYEAEYDLLVASEYAAARPGEGAVPVSLVKANVPVQYRVNDLYAYIYNYDQPRKLLEAICYRELTKFAASAKIEVDTGPGGSSELAESLLGAGRDKAKQILIDRIQAAANEARLGVEIVFLGVQGVHPPEAVAKDYQAVTGAVQEKQQLILDAQAKRYEDLTSLAGSVTNAEQLYQLAQEYQQAKAAGDTETGDRLAAALDKGFAAAGGDIFTRLREAQSYAYSKTALARATGLRFADQLKAYRAAEGIYKKELRLRVFEEALENTRKYLVVADPADKTVFIVNLEEELIPSLYDITGLDGSSEK